MPRGSSSTSDPRATSQPLRYATGRRKSRARRVLAVGFAVLLVAMFLWVGRTVIQLASSEPIPPLALLIPADQVAVAKDLAAARGQIARLSAAVEASELMVARLRVELAVARQEVETARQTTSAGTREQLYAALASAIDAEKGAAGVQAATMRLGGANTRLTNELTKAKAVVDEAEVVSLREELAAPQQEAGSTQSPTGPGATAPSDQNPVADQKDPDQTQDAEDVEAAPEIEEILTATEISLDPATSVTIVLRDTVSPDDLLHEPAHHVGREVVVTGSVVWLLRRYWLQSDSGHMSMLIDVGGLQSDDRNKLKDAVVQIEFLAQARARITGTIERQGSENHHLAATELMLVE